MIYTLFFVHSVESTYTILIFLNTHAYVLITIKLIVFIIKLNVKMI